MFSKNIRRAPVHALAPVLAYLFHCRCGPNRCSSYKSKGSQGRGSYADILGCLCPLDVLWGGAFLLGSWPLRHTRHMHACSEATKESISLLSAVLFGTLWYSACRPGADEASFSVCSCVGDRRRARQARLVSSRKKNMAVSRWLGRMSGGAHRSLAVSLDKAADRAGCTLEVCARPAHACPSFQYLVHAISWLQELPEYR